MTSAKLIPEEINASPIFQKVALKLVAMFQEYFPYFKPKDAINFAKYLSESMIDYLGSDRILPYLSLEMQLIRGATEGLKKSKEKIKLDPNRDIFQTGEQTHFSMKSIRSPLGVSWSLRGIVKRSNIVTADGRKFDNPAHKSKYLTRTGTAEEALRLNYTAPK